MDHEWNTATLQSLPMSRKVSVFLHQRGRRPSLLSSDLDNLVLSSLTLDRTVVSPRLRSFVSWSHRWSRVSCKHRQPRQTDCLTPIQFRTGIKQSVCLGCLCLHDTLDLPSHLLTQLSIKLSELTAPRTSEHPLSDHRGSFLTTSSYLIPLSHSFEAPDFLLDNGETS